MKTYLDKNIIYKLFAIVFIAFSLIVLELGNIRLEISEVLQDMLTLLLGIIVEALPFVIFGTLISALVAVYVQEDWVLNKLPKNKFFSHLFISFAGILMPVCECGNVPVSRRLMLKGFKPSQAITFLLAAPIINPVTLFATWRAFDPDYSYVIIRFIAALFIANFVGLLFSYLKNQEELITQRFNIQCHSHDHEHIQSKLDKGIKVFQDEFIEVMKMLSVGALIAANIRTFVPESVLESIGNNIILSVLAMMIFAFTISICSNVDAFVVLGYADKFTKGSILTFLVFGPMIDIKILTMLKTTFKVRTLIIMTFLVSLLSIITGLIVNYFL